jgi:transcriptional repressor NrdR
LAPLSELDEVAYLRFASVYRHWHSADDFLAEISALQAKQCPQPAVTTASD